MFRMYTQTTPLTNKSQAIFASRRNYRCSNFARKLFVICIFLAAVTTWSIVGVDAWKHCLPEEGGGICPDGDTCCPTGTPGISSCVPGRAKDPKGARGQCCDLEGTTGCAYGYDCTWKEDIDADADTYSKPRKQQQQQQQQQVCKRREPHPENLNAKETPRYELCRLPSSSLSPETYDLQKFPMDGFNAVYYSSMGSILVDDNDMQKFSSVETVLVIVHGSGRNADGYLCAGISTFMAISKCNENANRSSSYLGNINHNDMDNGKVLVIAPKFVADVDHDDRSRYPNTLYWLEHGKNVPLEHTWRYGADAANTQSKANVNASEIDEDNGNGQGGLKGKNGISSYAVMDSLLEFLIGSKQPKSLRHSNHHHQQQTFQFPKLKRIVVAGHSAGGQYVHRWALLSSNPTIWGDINDNVHKFSSVSRNETRAAKTRKIETRLIVANPRSYCYPDSRRMIRADKGVTSDGNDTIGVDMNVKDDVRTDLKIDRKKGIDVHYSYVFAVPDPRDVDTCPTYDQWQWGLKPGGDIPSPYKDAALDLFRNNLTALALRYSKRKVYYLAGEHDTIEQEDRCETYNFQGDTRNERARRYFQALTEYLATCEANQKISSIKSSTGMKSTNLIHEFHQVPGSPHDHTLMFQSAIAREAFYGTECESSMGDIEIDH